MTLYTSPDAKVNLQRWFPRFLARVAVPTEARTVPTRFGDTHLLVGGPADGPPVLAFHGALATSAHMMSEINPLLRRFRVYAPDVIGHSPMSADLRLPLDSYGPWAVEVLDALGLASTNVLGVSYGGFVAQCLAKTAPSRVSKLSLVVPAGLAAGSAWVGVTQLAIPMAMYRWFPSEARLDTFVRPQFTTIDEAWVQWIGEAIRGFTLDFRAPPISKPEDFRDLSAPVQVFGASDDVHFPGPAVLERARLVFQNLAQAELIANCKHSPPFEDTFREWLGAKVVGFLDPAR